jgi:hypothetical protein
VKHAAAHGAAANHAKVYLLHKSHKIAVKWSRGQFNFEPRKTRSTRNLCRKKAPVLLSSTVEGGQKAQEKPVLTTDEHGWTRIGAN